MPPSRTRLLFLAIVLTIACSTSPTELCGCPPARTAVIVKGALIDASGAPVPNAEVFLAGLPGGVNIAVRIERAGIRVTAGDGFFRSQAYSVFPNAEQELHAAVIHRGGADTTLLRAGPAPFR